MRQNRWNDKEAQARVDAAGSDPADQTLALRVYSSRIIGADPDLVMHGGGNTSVKTERKDLFGNLQKVLHVKGSGWDLDTLEAPGLPGVRLAPLLEMRKLDALSDEDMVNMQRSNLLDSSAPNPSVETLLHAFLPHNFVDHTHATAFLALANLPDAEAAIHEIFGDRLAVVPYIMPGFALAKKAAEVFDANPDCEGLILLKHGHFTFGATARESYDKVIEHTNMVEEWLAARANGRSFDLTVQRDRSIPDADLAAPVLPLLRGAIGRLRGAHHASAPRPVVMDVRSGEAIDAFLHRGDLEQLAQRGVASPDHVIRTKGRMLVLGKQDLASGREGIQARVDEFAKAYHAMFDAQNQRVGGGKVMLEPHPCVAWVEGLGIIGIGKDASAAAAAADIAEQTVEVMTLGEAAGGFRPIGPDDLFDMEYWSLEQAKLAKAAAKPFTGQVVAVTGGAGAIGLATAKAFAREGAAIALIDFNAEACKAAAAAIGPNCLAVVADLTAKGAADKAVAEIVERFGGLDVLVSNAGAAIQGMLLDFDEDTLRSSFELNFFSHLAMARAAARVFAAQEHGGQMLFNVSKQAVNPGKGFGAYGLPKAATFFLVRQLALELGGSGVRVNGVNADRIRSGLLTDDFIKSRAEARGVSASDYMAGNLLKAEVEAHHVADAFMALAKSERTTAHVITVDGGNIEAALR
ncbi:MAG: bifunctional aldolase/short-chain dehydrogenase [Hoeflea sp.]|uniref:bifunctional aldolase/short-chain dehydrogenase n=1 Tax=Hoeflea sp. TaxID=1940281 RepID=UPI000C0D098F|nr:bifunctional aldolase/short-chain dehydrogenase [Hoeflea sp.]PHR25322.1 MAG: bifunctional aldolase/short-chain dehydrogenase [Hoeflea sp.]